MSCNTGTSPSVRHSAHHRQVASEVVSHGMMDCTDVGTGVSALGSLQCWTWVVSRGSLCFPTTVFQFCKRVNQHFLLSRGHDFIDAVVEGERLTG